MKEIATTVVLERPDLVMLDMTMAGMHGLEVLEKLRQMDATATVIVATADIQTSTQVLASAGGACAFVSKPFTTQNVLDAVGAVLAGGRPC